MVQEYLYKELSRIDLAVLSDIVPGSLSAPKNKVDSKLLSFEIVQPLDSCILAAFKKNWLNNAFWVRLCYF